MSDSIRFKIALVQEGDIWVCQCLEVDICGQGDTPHEAVKRMTLSLHAHMQENISAARAPLDGLPPAPKRFWDAYEAAPEHINTGPIPFVLKPPTVH